MALQVYSQVYVAIDGKLQQQEYKASLTHECDKPARIAVHYCVPSTALDAAGRRGGAPEFDPRAAMVGPSLFDVALFFGNLHLASSLDGVAPFMSIKARVVGVAVTGGVDESSSLTVTFEDVGAAAE